MFAEKHSETSAQPTSPDLDKFHDVLKKAKRIVVLAGPGLAPASGHVHATHDSGNAWQLLDATPAAFAANPSLVWQMYHHRRLQAIAAKPTPIHILLAKLSDKHFRKTLMPHSKEFHVITHATDRLSYTSLETLIDHPNGKAAEGGHAERDSLIQMHGSVLDVRCEGCGYKDEDLSGALCPALDHDVVMDGVEGAGAGGSHGWREIDAKDLPRCPKCGSLARPGAVFAGERPRQLEKVDRLVKKADLCIVLGTSMRTHPGATYLDHMRDNKGKVAVFTANPIKSDEKADFLFRGPCWEELPRVLGVNHSVTPSQ